MSAPQMIEDRVAKLEGFARLIEGAYAEAEVSALSPSSWSSALR